MKALERFIHALARFAVGFGSGLALVCTFVVVTTDVGLGPAKVAPVEVIRLDPVVVTISAERFAAIRAEATAEPVIVRVPDHGPGEG